MSLENTFPRWSNGVDSEEDETRLFRLEWNFLVGTLLARGRRALINFGTLLLDGVTFAGRRDECFFVGLMLLLKGLWLFLILWRGEVSLAL